VPLRRRRAPGVNHCGRSAVQQSACLPAKPLCCSS